MLLFPSPAPAARLLLALLLFGLLPIVLPGAADAQVRRCVTAVR